MKKNDKRKFNGGASTRVTHIELPKGIHYSNYLTQPFRVVVKNKVWGYKQWYFCSLKDAIKFKKGMINE